MAVRVNILTTYNGAGNKKALHDLALMEKQATLAGNSMAAGMFKASAGMEKAGASMSKTGATLSKNVTLPVVALGALAVNAAAKFETSMNQVQAASGASGKEMKSLSAYALKMGADTMFSAGEAADAMLELSKGGMKAAAIKAGGLKAALDLAAAGNMELAAAAETTIQAMGMFSLKAKAAGSVAAALAGGANASTASVESLAQALSQVGPGAGNAGMSLQQTVGVLAAFADKGIKGSDAGTSLKTMLSRLVPTTDAAAKAMERYGLSFVDGKGNIDDISVVAEKLKDKLGGLTQAQRISAMTTIFGSDATRAATVLMGEGAEGLKKYIKAASDKTAAEKMAEARTKGFAGTLESLKGSVETIAIVFGQVLIPVLSNLAKYLTALVNKFINLSDTQKKWIVTVLSIAAALGPVLFIVGKLTSGIGRVVGVVGKLTLAFGKGGAAAPKYARALAGATKGLASFVKQGALAVVSLAKQAAAWAVHAAKQASYTAMGISLMVKDAAAKVAATAATAAHTVATVASTVATKAAAAGQWLLNAAMRANPIGLIIVAITALVGVFVLLWTKCDWFRNFWIAVWEEVKAVAAAVWPAIKAVGEQIVAALQWTWDAVSAAVTWFWNWAGAFITAGVTTWWTVIKTTVAAIVAVVQAAWTAIVAAVQWFWGWAGPFITAGVRTWWTIISTTFTTIIDVVRSAWNTIKSVVTTAIAAVVAVIHTIEAVVGFVRGVWDRVHGAAVTVWDAITGAVRAAIGNVKAAIHAVDSVVAFVRGVFNDINSVASNVGDKIAATVGDIWRGIKGVAKNVWDDIVGVVKGAWNNIKNFANDIIDVINHVVKVVPGLGNNVPGYPFPEFAVGGAANGPSTGYPVIMHGRETVVAHDNPGRGLADLAGSGILGGGKKAPRVSASALTFETRGPHVGADEDSGGRSILGSIGSAIGAAAGWVGDLVSKYNIFNRLPKPVGGLFGGATNVLLDMGKDAIVGLLEKFGLGDRQKIVNFAKSQLEMPYVWGGASPAAGGFDCSGLMQWAYRQAGHNVQWRVPTYGGHQIPRGAVQPADIMFYYPGAIQNGQRVPFGHFKMYAGDGQTIESTSGGVQMRAADWAGAAQIRQYLAKGGYVPRTAGGLAAVLGEGNEGEYVVPESKVGRFATAALAGSGGAYIAPGAVVVNVTGGVGSPSEITATVRAGVEPALEALARAITAL